MEMLAEISRSYNVSGWTIARLQLRIAQATGEFMP
jgi:hypothetical protein